MLLERDILVPAARPLLGPTDAHVARLHGDWKTWDAFTIYLEGDDEEATELVEYLTGGERQQ